jgi:hypothetical protein
VPASLRHRRALREQRILRVGLRPARRIAGNIETLRRALDHICCRTSLPPFGPIRPYGSKKKQFRRSRLDQLTAKITVNSLEIVDFCPKTANSSYRTVNNSELAVNFIFNMCFSAHRPVCGIITNSLGRELRPTCAILFSRSIRHGRLSKFSPETQCLP